MKYVGLLSAILVCNIVYTQPVKDRTILVSNVPLSIYIGGMFTQDYFLDGRNSRDSIQESGLCWLKIKVLADLSLAEVEVSPGTNSKLAEYFKQTVFETQGKWKISNQLQICDSLIIIVPIYYSLMFNNKANSIKPDPLQTMKFLAPANGPTQVFLYPQVTCANYLLEPANDDDVKPQKMSQDTMNQKVF